MKSILIAGITVLTLLVGHSVAEIQVPEDFKLDKITNFSGRLCAIKSSEYGAGVIAASIDQGILQVNIINQSSINLLATKAGFPSDSYVLDVEFDNTGLFSNKLYLSISSNVNTHTDIIQILEDGTIIEKISIGDYNKKLAFIIAITDGSNGYSKGAYLLDINIGDGSSLYHMESNFILKKLSDDTVPNSRTDLDITEAEFDPIGVYGGYLTVTDHDPNHDGLSSVWQLKPDLTWEEFIAPVNVSERHYTDMKFSSGGDFGQNLYIADRISGKIKNVDSDGIHKDFASGFTELDSIAITPDGNRMFISDENGIYRILKSTTTVGPIIVMREPKAVYDDMHSGDTGVKNVTIQWSDNVEFASNDITITDESGSEIPSSVTGDKTPFMLIAFGKTLFNNKYTVTINETVHSFNSGAAIDGDNDGIAGGNAVFMMEHRKKPDGDFNNNGTLGLDDCIGILQILTGLISE